MVMDDNMPLSEIAKHIDKMEERLKEILAQEQGKNDKNN